MGVTRHEDVLLADLKPDQTLLPEVVAAHRRELRGRGSRLELLAADAWRVPPAG